NAEQESRVLMLSDKARGDANPILLIDENDVTAGHAASVGRIDPLQLYYLMSRGITREEAENLIIFSFLEPVVDELPIPAVQKQLRQVIERKVHSWMCKPLSVRFRFCIRKFMGTRWFIWTPQQRRKNLCRLSRQSSATTGRITLMCTAACIR